MTHKRANYQAQRITGGSDPAFTVPTTRALTSTPIVFVCVLIQSGIVFFFVFHSLVFEKRRVLQPVCLQACSRCCVHLRYRVE